MLRRGSFLLQQECIAASAVSAINSPSDLMSLEAPEPRLVSMKPSSSPWRRPSIYFPINVDAIPSEVRGVLASDMGTSLPTYRIASPTCDYYALRIPLLKAGFRRVPDDAVGFPSNLVWGKSAPVTAASPRWDQYVPRNAFQMFNHFPRSHKHLGCKRGMALSLRNWEDSVTSTFTPQTLFYPSEKKAIENLMINGPPGKRYIWKPARGSCGRGIMISRSGAEDDSWRAIMKDIDFRASDTTSPDVARIPYMSYVVQEYVENPLVIDGRKLDLRLYVCVTSFDPLKVFLHSEGLVRFAAESYGSSSESSNGDARFKHLTNYSLGRKLEADQHGSLDLKWPLKKFESRLGELYGTDHATLSYNALMAKAKNVIVETLLASKKNISAATRQQTAESGDNYVELFGFDVMFDSAGNAWLIEVNTLPSLESSSTMDYQVKSAVITDMLNLAQVKLFPRSDSVFEACGLLPPPPSSDPAVVKLLQSFLQSAAPGRDMEVIARKSTEPLSSDVVLDLQMVIQDENKYCGGFKRIFPTSTRSQAHWDATLTSLDVAAAALVQH